MPDYDKIKRNIDRMINQGAPREDIDQYIFGEGVTADELRRGRKPYIGEKVIDWAVQTAKGKHDPRFKDVPAFKGKGINWYDPGGRPTVPMAGAITLTDPAYGGVIKKQLGKRLIGTETDANGYEIIKYRGDDGKNYQTYINKTGLDPLDVERALAATVPSSIVGGVAGLAGRVAMGSGLFSRAGTQ